MLKQCNGRTIIHLKKDDVGHSGGNHQPWDASVKSLAAFPESMALMGENPQWVQNPGDAFLGAAQDAMESGQRSAAAAHKRLAEVMNPTESYYHNEESLPVKQTVTSRHTIQYRSTATPVIR
ncbi:DUF3300 domain-containing protein [Shigella flexneri]